MADVLCVELMTVACTTDDGTKFVVLLGKVDIGGDVIHQRCGSGYESTFEWFVLHSGFLDLTLMSIDCIPLPTDC